METVRASANNRDVVGEDFNQVVVGCRQGAGAGECARGLRWHSPFEVREEVPTDAIPEVAVVFVRRIIHERQAEFFCE